jgi:hypothetical protein
LLNPWHAPTEKVEYCVQPIGMLFRQILNDIREIVPGSREPFLRPSFGLSTSIVGREVRNVPPSDKVTKRYDAWMLCKLAEGVDCQKIGRLQPNLDPFVGLVGQVPAGGLANAFAEVQEPERLAAPPAPPFQPFFDDHRSAAVFVER